MCFAADVLQARGQPDLPSPEGVCVAVLVMLSRIVYQRLPLPQSTLLACRFGGFDDEDELDAAEGLEEEEGQVRGSGLGGALASQMCIVWGVGGWMRAQEMHCDHTRRSLRSNEAQADCRACTRRQQASVPPELLAMLCG